MDGVVEDAVEADGGEEQRNDGEERGERGEETLPNSLALDELVLGVDIAHAEVGTNLRNGATERGSQSEGIGGVSTDDETGAGGAPPSLGIGREEWKECGGKGVFADAAIFGVADDADDLEVNALAVGKHFVEIFAERIFILEEKFWQRSG